MFLNAQSLYALDDGVYLLKEGPRGSSIRFPGGYPAAIDRKLDREEYDIAVVSASNSNDLFEIRLTARLNKAPEVAYLAIVLGDKVIVERGGDHWFEKCDRDLAVQIAALTGGAPFMRKNVAAALSIRFLPRKKVYGAREPIEFVVELKNSGAASLFLQREMPSKDRSARMEIVLDEGSPVSCTDVRSKFGKVSVAEPRSELKPGEVTELRQEDLRRWFIPNRTGAPVFKIIYEFPIYESMTAPYPVWIEHFADSLTIQYHRGG